LTSPPDRAGIPSPLRLHKTPAVGIMPLSKELTVAKEDVV
jgi:hypothetical protein